MTDLRMIAEKLAARRATFAKPRVRPKDWIDRSYEILFRYPTVGILSLVVIGGLVGMAIALIWFVASSGAF